MLTPFNCTRTVNVFHQQLTVTADITGTAADPFVDIIEVRRADGTTIHSLTAMEKYDVTQALLSKLQKEKEEYDATAK